MMVTCEICRKSLASNLLMCPIMNQSAVKWGVLPENPIWHRFSPCRRVVAVALYQQVGAAVGVDVGGHRRSGDTGETERKEAIFKLIAG